MSTVTLQELNEHAAMSITEFKRGILSLADPDDPAFISERVIARRIAMLYMDADDECRRDMSQMLRQDLAAAKEDAEGEHPTCVENEIAAYVEVLSDKA